MPYVLYLGQQYQQQPMEGSCWMTGSKINETQWLKQSKQIWSNKMNMYHITSTKIEA